MVNPADIIEANLRHVLGRIADATAAAGRRDGSVCLVAVSKFQPLDSVAAALAAGQLRFGENRVQEAVGKFTVLRRTAPALRLHLIGPLQTNKARDAVAVADTIETLDRPRLADALETAFAGSDRRPSLLIQVNVGDEPQKAGVARADADGFITECKHRFGASVVGLMCIPPVEGDPAPHFDWLADRAARHGLAEVSMGMSGDFETAIRHGATHVRVGTAVFGAR